MIYMKNFLRTLIPVLMIIFVTFGVTGCSSAIKGITQANKALKNVHTIIDAVELKGKIGDLADKILKHK